MFSKTVVKGIHYRVNFILFCIKLTDESIICHRFWTRVRRNVGPGAGQGISAMKSTATIRVVIKAKISFLGHVFVFSSGPL